MENLRRRGDEERDGSLLFDDWCPTSPRAALYLYEQLEALGWRHLPSEGGLLEQDDSLMQDIALISNIHALVRAQMDCNETELGSIDG